MKLPWTRGSRGSENRRRNTQQTANKQNLVLCRNIKFGRAGPEWGKCNNMDMNEKVEFIRELCIKYNECVKYMGKPGEMYITSYTK